MTDMPFLKFDTEEEQRIEALARDAVEKAKTIGQFEGFKTEAQQLTNDFFNYARLARGAGLGPERILDSFLAYVSHVSGAGREEAIMMLTVSVAAVSNNFFIDA